MNNIIFQNYHYHTYESNPSSPDSVASPRDYAKRAKELGHGIVSSLEHGFQGKYHKLYNLAQEEGLKFIFGTEAYWVKDRLAVNPETNRRDNTNSHLCLFAKNENGRRMINYILSVANEDGYYYSPRIDLELLYLLNPDDVFITSACVAYWKYEDIEDITLQLHKHFGNSMMLEVQAHNTPKQIAINKRIKQLAIDNSIKMIAGCDSHYIYPEDAQLRDIYLESKGIKYPEEDGWYMDYPDGNTLFNRFQEQSIFTDDEILQFINNTNIFLQFDDITFDKSRKIPRFNKDITHDQANELYSKLIFYQFEKEKTNIPEELHEMYHREVQSEVDVIASTGVADYFLMNYAVVKRGLEKGGILTETGRGSAVSYYTNKLLGFTSVDRIAAPVHLYPARFISQERLLQGSLPDIDFNTFTPEIFVEAQKEILGQHQAYPMVAYGTYKHKSAWQMYAKANNIPFETSMAVSNQITKYDDAVKYEDLEDDEETQLRIEDFIDNEYLDMLEHSKEYLDIVTDKKKHPCAYILSEDDIRYEIGLMLCKTESTKTEHLVAVIDGKTAEQFGYLKNDWLKVDVVGLISQTFDEINQEIPSVDELREMTSNDEKVWDIYKNGHTICINQVEKTSTTQKLQRFQPKNISELCAFVAGIRPSFKSIYPKLERREEFSYDIAAFDNLIQTEEMPNSFVLYQEQIMATLQYAGFKADITYNVMKAISKKNPQIINTYKKQFLDGFSKRIMEEDQVSSLDAKEMSLDIWKIIEDSSDYGFNASHSLCVSYDSLYGAYLKAYYPLEFYKIALNHYTNKGDKNKVALIKQEAQNAFNIKFQPIKWGNDNRGFRVNHSNNSIYTSMASVKKFSDQAAEDLYLLSQNNTYDNIIDLLYDIINKTSVNIGQLEVLAQINYFGEFAGEKTILALLPLFHKQHGLANNTRVGLSKIEKLNLNINDVIACGRMSDSGATVLDFDPKQFLTNYAKEYESDINKSTYNLFEKIIQEYDCVGTTTITNEKIPANIGVVIEFSKNQYGTGFIDLYRPFNGEMETLKIKGYILKDNPLQQFDIIQTINDAYEFKKRKIGGKFVVLEEKEHILYKYQTIQ